MMVFMNILERNVSYGRAMGFVMTTIWGRQARSVSGASAWECRVQCDVRQHALLVQQPHDQSLKHYVAPPLTSHQKTNNMSRQLVIKSLQAVCKRISFLR